MSTKAKHDGLDISIPSTAAITPVASKKKYVVYQIRCQLGRNVWTVIHRFSEFDSFNKAVRTKLKNASWLPKLPSKHAVKSSAGAALDATFIANRRIELQEYLQSLVATFTVDELLASKEMRDFFQIKVSKAKIEAPDSSSSYDLDDVDTRISLDDFQLIRTLGKGNFGTVIQVRYKATGQIFAMKVLDKKMLMDQEAVTSTLAEKNILKSISYPFLVNLRFSFQTKNKLYLVMDYLPGGELFFHLSNQGPFSEDRARFYAAEVCMALGHLHSKGVVYRDLKPENLLLDGDGHCCVTDFGLCKEGLGYSDRTTTFCGSPEYLAPEMLEGKGYTKDVDWWALGTILYEMISGLPPFYEENTFLMMKRIRRDPIVFGYEFSPAAKDLLLGLLERDPMKRLGSGARDASSIMKHPFFKDIDWEKLENRELEPPFRPQIENELDVRYFEEEFTSELPSIDTDELESGSIPSDVQQRFRGFTYVAPEGDPADEGATEDEKKSYKHRRRTDTRTQLDDVVIRPADERAGDDDEDLDI